MPRGYITPRVRRAFREYFVGVYLGRIRDHGQSTASSFSPQIQRFGVARTARPKGSPFPHERLLVRNQPCPLKF